jgi:hypothetical protein
VRPIWEAYKYRNKNVFNTEFINGLKNLIINFNTLLCSVGGEGGGGDIYDRRNKPFPRICSNPIFKLVSSSRNDSHVPALGTT